MSKFRELAGVNPFCREGWPDDTATCENRLEGQTLSIVLRAAA